MKHFLKYSIVLLAGLSMLACSKEIDEPITEDETPTDEYTYVIAIDEGTKSYLEGNYIAWEDGDGVGWYAVSGSYGYTRSGYSPINMSSDPRTFSVTCPISIDAGGHIYACAQYYGIDGDGQATMYIPSWQQGVVSNAMPMVSLPIDVNQRITANTTTPAGLAKFINLGSVIQYNVYTSNPAYASEEVTGVTFTATSPIAGDFTVDLTAVAEDAIPSPSGLTEDSVYTQVDTPTNPGSSKASGIKVYQVIAPGTWSGTVTVTTNVATYSYPVTNKEFSRSKIKTLNVDLASSTATRTEMARLLTARPWVLSTVTLDGSDVTQSAGDVIMFNANHSYSIDCSAHSDMVYDYNYSNWGDPTNDYGYDPTSTSAWSISCNIPYNGVSYLLNFDAGAFPLVVVDYCYSPLSYEIVSLDATSLVLRYYNNGEYLITFTGGAETIDSRLAKTWVLSSVTLNGYDSTYSAGDKMTLGADKSISLDCSANGNKVYDYYDTWGWIDYDYGYSPYTTLAWSVSESAGQSYLDLTECAYPVVITDNCWNDAISYEIVSLTENSLVLHHARMNDFTICFTAEGASVKSLLTATEWELASMKVEYSGTYYDNSIYSIGNKISFNSDYSMSFDCSANGGYTDNLSDGYIFEPDPSDIASMSWSLDNSDTTLSFPAGSYPIIVLENGPMSFSIERINALELILSFVYGGNNAKLVFSAV